jgi:hypothetical protein
MVTTKRPSGVREDHAQNIGALVPDRSAVASL